MPALTPVALLKSQLNLDATDNSDDALLAHKMLAAEQWITRHVGSDFDADDAVMTEAALQLAAYLFEQREAATDGNLKPVPFGIYNLLQSHREAVTGYVELEETAE